MRRPDAEPPFPPAPEIPPVPEGADRPLFSVMIPAYECTDHLEETLRSVLDQDPGPGRMEIAVVDDRSSTDRHERIARALAGSRVVCHTREKNVGLARSWNDCIARARGRWVHLLHQDDLVLPGFYDRLARADAEAPEAGAAFCRHIFIDGQGRRSHPSGLERPTPGLLEGWAGKIAETQRIQCPSIIVRRDVYERLGGFRTDLCYALDWEMWNRIAAGYPVWYEPEALACYRIHEGNETARLKRANRDLADVLRAIRIISGRAPAGHAGAIGSGLLAYFRGEELRGMIEGLSAGDLRLALAHLRRVDQCDPGFKRSREGFAYLKWSAKILGRGLLGALRGRRPGGEAGAGRP